MVRLLVVLRFLEVAARVAPHRTRVVLRRVLRLVVVAGAAHHANVLRDVLLADEVAHVVFVADRVLVVILLLLLLLLLLLDLLQLRVGELLNLPEHVDQASVGRLDCQASELLLHLRSHACSPAANLIIYQLHVLLSRFLSCEFLL